MQSLIVIVSCLVSIVSLWGIIYFAWRIFIRRKVMFEDFNMPSSDELRELYEKNNVIIKHHVK